MRTQEGTQAIAHFNFGVLVSKFTVHLSSRWTAVPYLSNQGTERSVLLVQSGGRGAIRKGGSNGELGSV